MLTDTPGRTAPLLSTARPVIVPVVDCAAAGTAPVTRRLATRTHKRHVPVILDLQSDVGTAHNLHQPRGYNSTIAMKLKKLYSSREVAQLTGLTARQLQWWAKAKLFPPAVESHKTEAGGFTERRYTPIELLELMVLADLRRKGFTVARIRKLLEVLKSISRPGCTKRSKAAARSRCSSTAKTSTPATTRATCSASSTTPRSR